MPLPLVGLLLGAALIISGCASTQYNTAAEREPSASQARQAEIEQVSVKEAAAILEADPRATLLDVRTPEEYAEGHAPGSKLRPLGDLAQWAPELDPKARYVVICRSGSRSMRASQQLVERGFTNVTNVKGGMLDWEAERLPMER